MTNTVKNYRTGISQPERVNDPGMESLWLSAGRSAWKLYTANPKMLRRYAKALRFVGNYFYAHPERFAQGTFADAANGSVCTLGLLTKEYRLASGIEPPPLRGVPAAPRNYEVRNWIMSNNDRQGITPVRLRKIYLQMADVLDQAAAQGLDRLAFERLAAKVFARRAKKAGFKRNKQLALASGK